MNNVTEPFFTMNFDKNHILEELRRADAVISDAFKDDVHKQRERVSKHAFDSLRVFVAYLCKAVYFIDEDIKEDFISEKVEKIAVLYARKKCNQLGNLYDCLNNTVMHVSINGDESVRLYFAYRDMIYDIQQFANSLFSERFLKPFDDYPDNMDETLKKYYLSVNDSFFNKSVTLFDDGIFYVDREKPIIVNGTRLFYELTLSSVGDTDNKFGRMVVFSKEKIKSNYAIKASLIMSTLSFIGSDVPVTLLTKWEVSIRPCELEKVAYYIGIDAKVYRKAKDYQNLMVFLNCNDVTLTDICSCNDHDFQKFINNIFGVDGTGTIVKILKRCHRLIINKSTGYRTIRYLLFRTNYDVLLQISPKPSDDPLTGNNLSVGCFPFELAPIARALPNHVPLLCDILGSQPSDDYSSQFVYRYLKTELKNNGRMYIPVQEIDSIFRNATTLVEKYNSETYKESSKIFKRFNHWYILKSEEDLCGIFDNFKKYMVEGDSRFLSLVESQEKEISFISDKKMAAVKKMFSASHVSFIYGPAGSGKTTLLSALSILFKRNNCLFLANTYAALNNMRTVVARNGVSGIRTFLSVKSFICGSNRGSFDVVFVDECSTISNEDFLSVLKKINPKKLVLVGDPEQIEAIEFGNWFSIAEIVFPSDTKTNLDENFRSNCQLEKLWKDLRKGDISDFTTDLVNGHYAKPIDTSIFNKISEDEIILALNYDGVYGVNNLNNILQSQNKEKGIRWRQRLYKKNDPIIFTATKLFSEEIYNNLKGTIVDVTATENRIQFLISVNSSGLSVGLYRGFECKSITEGGKAVISFYRDKPGQEYFDNGGDNRYSIPFQIAYAVSIHKAQGLEFDSVKVVVTEEAGEHLTKNILYTAITRSKRHLTIYWSPEVQSKVVSSFKMKNNENYSILKNAKLL